MVIVRLFSRGYATLHLAVSVGRSVCPSVHHIFEFRAVFALLLLPNRPQLDCHVSGLVSTPYWISGMKEYIAQTLYEASNPAIPSCIRLFIHSPDFISSNPTSSGPKWLWPQTSLIFCPASNWLRICLLMPPHVVMPQISSLMPQTLNPLSNLESKASLSLKSYLSGFD